MVRDLVVADPDDALQDIMEIMTQRRVRHLPVVRKTQLLGIVSIGDLINACLISAEDENAHLRQYIHGGR
jgi:CBS domain-containing protein